MTDTITEPDSERQQKLKVLLDDIKETQRLNLVGLEFLEGIINDNSGRVYHGVMDRPHSNIIVRGELANYCIPLESIITAFANPFVEDAFQGLPGVEVHPLGKWVRQHQTACIQPKGHAELPGTDSLAILIVGLLSDSDLFMDPDQSSFRNSLLRTYGAIKSPISDLYSSYLLGQFGATIDYNSGEISVQGTHGFTWHLGGLHDPDVRSYSISSSIREARRTHAEDSWHCMNNCNSLRYLLPTLTRAPRIFLEDEDDDLGHSEQIVKSVAKHWVPLRRAIDSGDINLPWLDRSDDDE
tara:strand:- start:866 stop:1756 length:891 start_codon:yes stop_codon:yes gene_type:complete